MDLISSSLKDAKVILNNIFQGILILIPICIAFIKSEFAIHIESRTLELLKEFSTLIGFALFVLMFGIGHLILKMALRIEITLGDIIHKNNIKEYHNIWNSYLETSFKTGIEPVVVRFYSNMLVGLKFELASIISIMFLVTEIEIIDQYYINLIPFYLHGPMLITASLLIVYLYYEAREGIVELHKLRKQIINCAK